ncbi:Cyclomaltodextrinase [Caloramator mitchellensis]|uniref:Cyclomaltodextrinase n=1 Tax=Caloramator mitchellensis TaxID=908809 RepID=A0A0R3JWJ8_CALMK|nr:glycoside hydrolase family 13 protein [Caloramator mitchellensis]KRQ87942.1 Cyclomaltodextrinase [Caloramator mitchellensis]
MFKEAVYHESDSTYAFAVDENTLCIKLKAKKDDLKRVILCYADRYEPKAELTIFEKEMERAFSDDLFDYYETEIKLTFNRVCYYFKLIDDKQSLIYSQQRFLQEPPKERNKFFFFPYICKADIYKTFDWWREAVFYQIFVDRFNKEEIDENWFDEPTNNRLFGGNLKGIIHKLDYISNLGVNAIYLTPIFESPSCHKYDTIDYYKIDSAFGDEKIFKELVDECHKRGIKVILDAVFNHTSDKFFAFKDILENGKKSRYYDWYFFKDEDKYETFAHVKCMPKLNTTNEEVVNYLLGIAKYYIEKFDIDGWRLDVANEIDHAFWRKFRETVKKAKEDAIIIGEVWDGAESYLRGDQYDSTMNYPFMYAALDYFAKGKITLLEFDYYMNNLYARYRKDIRYNLLNLLDSHDTSRFLFECDENIEKLKMAVFYMMTTIGIPMIFYGDEAGLSGANDPDCRITMDFEYINEDLFDFYRKMIQIRKSSKALMYGEYRTLKVSDSLYVYKRFIDDEEIICIFNNGSQKEEFEIEGTNAFDLISYEEINIKNNSMTIKPNEKLVLKINR